MNEERLDKLFKAYINSGSVVHSQRSILDAENLVSIEAFQIECAATDEERKEHFLRQCSAIAKILPEFDWSMLAIFQHLDPRIISLEILYYIATPQPDEYTVTFLQGLIRRISRVAVRKNLSMPPDEIAAQTLVMLRYIRDPIQRFPYCAGVTRRVGSFLEYTPQPIDLDYMDIRQFQALAQAIAQLLMSNYPREVSRLKAERIKADKRSRTLDPNCRFLVSHFLMTVAAENLCGVMSDAPQAADSSTENPLFKQCLENAREIVSLLEPQIAFCKTELSFFSSRLCVGCRITEERYGAGTVLQNDGKTICIRFDDGNQRSMKLIPELVSDRIAVEADQQEFEKRLYFSKNILKNASINEKILTEAQSRIKKLTSKGMPLDQLTELPLLQAIL